MKARLLRRFRLAQVGTPQEEIMSLRQTGTVADFRSSFELLAAPLTDTREAWLQGIFVNGLQEDIRAKIRLFGPRDLEHTMQLAQKVEDRNRALNQALGPRFPKSSPGLSSFRVGLNQVSQKPLISAPWNNTHSVPSKVLDASRLTGDFSKGSQPKQAEASGQRKPSNFKRLSTEEYQRKLEKGLCFRCDEKYRPNHICKEKQLRILIVAEDEDEEDDLLEGCEGEGKDETQTELSAHSMVGLDSPKTMKLKGNINEKGVTVLVDCGATHSFISQKLVDEL